ncbi:hypothetical protein OUZ56_009909 [Daphnia magna]|uniref:Uncharacterized protein n=1 Tax=Daphnia magna TaxID=35525 RepID=A0ABR0AH97_9CRUS|nr:hypothetical protein OUZ56_009909 [Daphnia magna]
MAPLFGLPVGPEKRTETRTIRKKASPVHRFFRFFPLDPGFDPGFHDPGHSPTHHFIFRKLKKD